LKSQLDAQVGNWLSWDRQGYPADKPGGPALKIDDILARVIFYKVGHHASHNATVRERGLERMTHSCLVAMIPVVGLTAREQETMTSPKGWAVPYDKLYQRVDGHTGGRIIRGDGDMTTEQHKFKGSISKLSYGPDFKDNDPLWASSSLMSSWRCKPESTRALSARSPLLQRQRYTDESAATHDIATMYRRFRCRYIGKSIFKLRQRSYHA
jgi:hypothetical protein